MNTNKGSVVKQSSNDVEGCRSQKILFQSNMREFLQYSVNNHGFQIRNCSNTKWREVCTVGTSMLQCQQGLKWYLCVSPQNNIKSENTKRGPQHGMRANDSGGARCLSAALGHWATRPLMNFPLNTVCTKTAFQNFIIVNSKLI